VTSTVLEFARKAAGLTQQDVAEYVGCNHVWIHRLESGKDKSASPAVCAKLEKLFGASFNELMREV
jgi:transcriptional regulator with XRE-family HTH domain